MKKPISITSILSFTETTEAQYELSRIMVLELNCLHVAIYWETQTPAEEMVAVYGKMANIYDNMGEMALSWLSRFFLVKEMGYAGTVSKPDYPGKVKELKAELGSEEDLDTVFLRALISFDLSYCTGDARQV